MEPFAQQPLAFPHTPHLYFRPRLRPALLSPPPGWVTVSQILPWTCSWVSLTWLGTHMLCWGIRKTWVTPSCLVREKAESMEVSSTKKGCDYGRNGSRNLKKKLWWGSDRCGLRWDDLTAEITPKDKTHTMKHTQEAVCVQLSSARKSNPSDCIKAPTTSWAISKCSAYTMSISHKNPWEVGVIISTVSVLQMWKLSLGVVTQLT